MIYFCIGMFLWLLVSFFLIVDYTGEIDELWQILIIPVIFIILPGVFVYCYFEKLIKDILNEK